MTDVDRLTTLIEPVLAAERAELVDLELAGTRGRPIVRAYVDTEGGVTLDACARLSRRIEAALEEAGAVPETYVLEVSSPGIERPLTRRSHFERFAGKDVDVRLHAKKGGRKRFLGVLETIEDRPDGGWAIVVRDADGEDRWTFESHEIARARLHVKW